MSGTSVDSIDAALVRIEGGKATLLATHQHDIPEATRQRVAQISHPGENEVVRMATLDRELGELFAEAALALISLAAISPAQVTAIGSHGQTIRHHPPSVSASTTEAFTVQIGDPNTIAEITGITTIADFRRRDIAAGGEGAPLAPAFHAAAFSMAGRNRAIVNIGGIANVTLLCEETLVAGFDTGPGNTLMDQWMLRHRGEPLDRDGAWAASGKPIRSLLDECLRHPYFRLSGPRSTGKETFNLPWLEELLNTTGPFAAADVQATLAELTAVTIAMGIRYAGEIDFDDIYICGGGAHNGHLMQRRAAQLAPAAVESTANCGLEPDWVEAAAFAWLAQRRLAGLPGNAPEVTGARGPRLLGSVYPGPA